MKPDYGAAAVFAGLAAWTSAVEPGAFFTTAFAIAILIGACVVTYGVAIRETRREIRAAFQDHLKQLHEEHRALVEEATDGEGR